MVGREKTTATDSLSVTVIESVADYEEEDVDNLPPLSNAINPDALNNLFEPRIDGTPRQGGQVAFTYCGYQVTIHRDGHVSIEE